MKRLMTLALGVSLLGGTFALFAAQDQSKSDTSSTTTKTKKKSKKSKKSDSSGTTSGQ